MTLLSIRDLHVAPPRGQTSGHPLRGLNLDIEAGEHLALLGSRDAGPGLLAATLLDRSRSRPVISQGTIWFETPRHGRLTLSRLHHRLADFVLAAPREPLRKLRDAAPIGAQIAREMRALGWRDRPTALARLMAALRDAGFDDPEPMLERKPGEFAERQQCRIALASIFACAPGVVFFEEPQVADGILLAEYAAVLRDLCRRHQNALLTVTSSPTIAAEMSDRLLVFHAGQIVEAGETDAILRLPRHPYTGALVGMEPQSRRPGQPLASLVGRAPDPHDLPDGCPFHERCANALAGCYLDNPSLIETSGRLLACHRPLESGE
ncbi:ABC transporter ATP-binding protein [Rhodobacteraceae bacterium NNCM2]|nr:ABC transporter ATP-binding protein [Coraliihabitans acroporae]